MDDLYQLKNVKSRSICPENFTGEKGTGGMAETGTGASCARDLGKGWKVSPSILLKAGETVELANMEGPGMIRHIWMTDSSSRNRSMILRIYWDGSDVPSVEVPLGDFFASADIMKYQQLTSIMVCVNPRRAYNCYWSMPFYEHCRMTLENISEEDFYVFYQIDYTLEELKPGCGYFHASFRRSNPLPYKEDYVILKGVQGKGQYVGTYLFWGVHNNGWWGEGEIKFYMDNDQKYPTICGTGTEDYFCGSYDFEVDNQYMEYITPYAGLSKVLRPDGCYNSQTRFSMYRWHVKDPIYFDSDLRVTIQALGWRSGGRYLPLQDDISSVAYYYLDHPSDCQSEVNDRDYLELI